MGFSLRNLWEASDVWDKEENKQQRAAQTIRSAQKASPAQTISMPSYQGQAPSPIKRSNPRLAQLDQSLRSGRINRNQYMAAIDSISNPVANDWRDNMPNTPVEKIASGAQEFGKAAKIIGKGIVSPDTYIGGAKRFNQAVASTVLSPVSNRLADQERQRAERLLTPAYQNLYRNYGADPRMGANQAQIEAGQADYNLRTDPLTRSNIGVNDSTGTVARKVGAKGAEALLDMVTAPTTGLALKSAVKSQARPFAVNTFKSGLLGAGGSLSYAAQQDNMNPLDYVTAGSQGFAVSAGLPLAVGATTKLVKAGIPVAKQGAETFNKTLESPGLAELRNTRQGLAQRYDGASSKLRKDINRALVDLDDEIRRGSGERGSISAGGNNVSPELSAKINKLSKADSVSTRLAQTKGDSKSRATVQSDPKSVPRFLKKLRKVI